jgi:hypothetical protein
MFGAVCRAKIIGFAFVMCAARARCVAFQLKVIEICRHLIVWPMSKCSLRT